MQIKSKWTMWRHFKHLCFKTFLMVSWGPIWCLFAFPTKALNIHNPCMNVTPKVEMHLGVIGLHLLHYPPFVWNTLSWFHRPLHSTLNHKPNVRVATRIGKQWEWKLMVQCNTRSYGTWKTSTKTQKVSA